MKRTYTLGRRAEKQAETRLRIVEAAIELHRTMGPALTSLSMVAERAAVQRHTLYAHFPDERSLQMACSGLTLERDPLPPAEPWRNIAARGERLRVGLSAIYGWYERNADLAGCVLRDAEFHALTRETVELRLGPSLKSYRDVLRAELSAEQVAMLGVGLSFFTWRTLAREQGLSTPAAVAAMSKAIEAQ